MSNVLAIPTNAAATTTAFHSQSPGARSTRPVPPIPLVTAIKSLAPMAGRSKPWLLLADDGRRYIVKLTHNPYGPRILANEFLGTRLAREVGLAVSDMAVVRVREGTPHPAGLHFGSRVHLNWSQTIAHDWLPEPAWSLVANPDHLIGAYVFDMWAGNADHRQVIFTRLSGHRPFTMRLVDQGHCFGGPIWRFIDTPLHVLPSTRFAYRAVSGWSDLEPWLTRIEQLPEERIGQLAAGLPPEWLVPASCAPDFARLIESLVARRRTLRELIANVLAQGGHPFPCWRCRSALFAVAGAPTRRQSA